MEPTPPEPLESAYTIGQILRHGPVRQLLLSQAALGAGVAMQAATLGKQVFDITGREVDIGFIGLAEFLPAALLVLVTGVAADRFRRKTIALLAMVGELSCAVVLMLYARTDPSRVMPLMLVAAAFGVARAFIAPAMRSMPPMVAPPGGLPKVIALWGACFTGAAIIGPAVSGFLYAIDPWVAYAAAAGLMSVAIGAMGRVAFVRAPAKPVPSERPTIAHAVEGLRFIRRTPILFAAISLDLFAVLFGGAVALLPAIAEERLGVGDVAYGWLRAAPGIGAAAMAVLIAIRPVRRRIGRSLLVAVGVFGMATIVLGLTRSYAVAFVALLIASSADMISVFVRSSLVPLVTPDDKRGRVLAVENVFIGASNELGAFESGVVGQALGTSQAVVGGGVATLAVVAIWWARFPALREVDRFDDLRDVATVPPRQQRHAATGGQEDAT